MQKFLIFVNVNILVKKFVYKFYIQFIYIKGLKLCQIQFDT